MITKRAAGILLPLFSLPSNEGRGCLDDNAFKFIDWLKETKQSYWQLLPIGPTFRYGNPYSAYSSFGGDPAFISLERLVSREVISTLPPKKYLKKLSLNTLRERKMNFIMDHLHQAPENNKSYKAFIHNNENWLLDFTAFSFLSSTYGKRWSKWPAKFKHYDSKVVQDIVETEPEARRILITQWLFFEQWIELRLYAKQRGVDLIGDVPIYVDRHSVDLWPSKHLFKLDSKGSPLFVSGAPPDQFSTDGQVWNTPIFKWDKHLEEDFRWWKKRITNIFNLFDIVRIDHFRGLEAYWEIPNEKVPDAKKGKWVKAPGRELFQELSRNDDYSLVVEDLGDIDYNVRNLRDDFNLPGMKILQFAFDTDSSNEYLPEHITPNSIVYTGTHDNNTIMGWRDEIQSNDIIVKNLKTIVGISLEKDFNWKMIELAHTSKANTSIIPFSDILGTGPKGRINVPGTVQGNWSWKFSWSELTEQMTAQLKNLTIQSNRCNEQ